MKTEPTTHASCDLVIVGGALAGAATAILLLRQQPKLRVLVVEKSREFTRRVGEATVEVSCCFIGRQLGLVQYLNEAHLVKQGMRFHFFNEQTRTLEECSEIGGRYLARVPAFQVDRSTLDEEVLRRARALGAEVWRPASAQKIELVGAGQQRVTVRRDDETHTVEARWVVDASGGAAVLSRQQGWWRANTAHPTTAVWSRWRGVRDWDGYELAQKFPKWAQACYGMRGTATNHLVGDGWWAWIIPLKGGDVSIGVVFDQRLMQWPENGSLGQRLKDFLCRHPVGRELMADAQWVEGDVHWRKNLPYYSTTYAGDGYALVGDAGSFLDPFYSPGMDWVSFTTYSTAQPILAQQRGEDLAPLLARHNRDFTRSYERWFDAVYRDKYEYLGDYDLMRLAFLLDVGFYYLGVASQPFKRGAGAFREPLFSNPPSVPFYHLMRTYGRRFAAMARSRRARGVWGRRNAGQRFMFPGYTFTGGSMLPIAKALLNWGWLELTEGWRSWFGQSPAAKAVEKPLPVTAPTPSQAV
ncbi:MAG TPA: tryptophan 7-halogenase [Verrucomicrobiae bacterium]